MRTNRLTAGFRADLTAAPCGGMLSGMIYVARWFLVFALLLAPVLHATAMSAPGPVAGCAHGHADGDDETAPGGTAPTHGSGFHASCTGTGACDLHVILLDSPPSRGMSSAFDSARFDNPAGQRPVPDPLPPRRSF